MGDEKKKGLSHIADTPLGIENLLCIQLCILPARPTPVFKYIYIFFFISTCEG